MAKCFKHSKVLEYRQQRLIKVYLKSYKTRETMEFCVGVGAIGWVRYISLKCQLYSCELEEKESKLGALIAKIQLTHRKRGTHSNGDGRRNHHKRSSPKKEKKKKKKIKSK